MASKPEELPESIILSRFQGLRNNIGRERLGLGELERATNVDIDDADQVRRRRGYNLRDAAEWHSLKTIGGRVLGVRNGTLCQIGTDFTYEELWAGVGVDPLSYTQIDETTYFASASVSGKLTGSVVSPWGAESSEGVWVSPVKTPTETLGEVFGKFVSAPPMATGLTAYSGRIYLLAGKYVWVTELFLPDYVDRSRGFMPLEHEGTMIAAASDGVYIGTEGGLYFAKGTLAKGYEFNKVMDAGVIRGTAVDVPATDVHPAAQQGPAPEGTATMVMTTAGICALFDGGQVYNLTYRRMAFPEAQSGAALFREDRGISSYVVAANSGGGAVANARIGDYCDAEIVRAADRLGG